MPGFRWTVWFGPLLLVLVGLVLAGCPGGHNADPLPAARPKGARQLADLGEDLLAEIRRAQAASLRVSARSLASSRVRVAVRLDDSGQSLRIDTEVCPAAALLRRFPFVGDEGAKAHTARYFTLSLTDANARAAADEFLHTVLRWTGVAADAAAANLTGLPGHRRLHVQPPERAEPNNAGRATRDFTAVVARVTGHLLDVAPPDGQTLFAVRTASGQTRYALAGQFYLAADGFLATASGLLALPPEAKRLPENATEVHLNADGELVATVPSSVVKGQILGGARRRILGRLRRVRFDNPAALAAEARSRETVYIATTAAGPPTAVKPGEGRLRPGLLLADRVDRAAEAAALVQAEELREVALAALRALARAQERARHKQRAASARRTLTVVGSLPWTVRFLENVGQPLERASAGPVLDVTDRAATLRNLLAALTGLQLRRKVHRENIENAHRTRDPAGNKVPYRRRLVQIGPGGTVGIREDPAPPREVYDPKHPDADEKGKVLYPNVFVKVEYSKLVAAVREFNLLRETIMRLSPDHVIPRVPLPPPPPDENGAGGKQP